MLSGIPMKTVEAVDLIFKETNSDFTENYTGNPVDLSFFKISEDFGEKGEDGYYRGQIAKGKKFTYSLEGYTLDENYDKTKATVIWTFKGVKGEGEIRLDTNNDNGNPNIAFNFPNGEIKQSITIKANSDKVNLKDALGFSFGVGDIDKGQSFSIKKSDITQFKMGKDVKLTEGNNYKFSGLKTTETDNPSGDDPDSSMGVIIGKRIDLAQSFTFNCTANWGDGNCAFAFNFYQKKTQNNSSLHYYPNGGRWTSNYKKTEYYKAVKKGEDTVLETQDKRPFSLTRKMTLFDRKPLYYIENKTTNGYTTYTWNTVNAKGKTVKKSKDVLTSKIIQKKADASVLTYTYKYQTFTTCAPIYKSTAIKYQKYFFKGWYPQKNDKAPESLVSDAVTPEGNKKLFLYTPDAKEPKDTIRQVYARYQLQTVPLATLIFKGRGGTYSGGSSQYKQANAGLQGDSVTCSNQSPFSGNSPSTQTYKSDIATFSVPIPVNPGYKFLGYSKTQVAATNYPNKPSFTEAFTGGFTLSNTENTVYAVWQKIQPTVTIKPTEDIDPATPGTQDTFEYTADTDVYMWVKVGVDCAVMPFYSTSAINGKKETSEVGGIRARFTSSAWGGIPIVSDKCVAPAGGEVLLFIKFHTPKTLGNGFCDVDITVNAPHGRGMTNFTQNDASYAKGEAKTKIYYTIVKKKENTPPDTNIALPEDSDKDKDGYIDNDEFDSTKTSGKTLGAIANELQSKQEVADYSGSKPSSWFGNNKGDSAVLTKIYDNRPSGDEVKENRSGTWSWYNCENTTYVDVPTFTQLSQTASIDGTKIQPADMSGKKVYYKNETGKKTLGSGISEITLGSGVAAAQSTLRQIKAGYGITVNQKAALNSSGNNVRRVYNGSGFDNFYMGNGAVGTYPQSGVAYFPEFLYANGKTAGVGKTYDRLIEIGDSGNLQFTVNPYSIKEKRNHYTPLWYPQTKINSAYNKGGATAALKQPYTVFIKTTDSWIPGAKLTSSQFSPIAIKWNLALDYTAASGGWGTVIPFEDDSITIDETGDDAKLR
jgi:hypothetical protein